MVGFGYLAGVMAHNLIVKYFPASGVMDKAISRDDCDKFLALCAANYDEFRALSKEHEVTDVTFKKYEFNVLHKRPLIALGEELIAPVPWILAHRVTEGLYFDLMDMFHEATGNKFLDYFGYLFEHYIGR